MKSDPRIDENLINQLELCLESARATKRFDDAESIQQAIVTEEVEYLVSAYKRYEYDRYDGHLDVLQHLSFIGYMVCETSELDGQLVHMGREILLTTIFGA